MQFNLLLLTCLSVQNLGMSGQVPSLARSQFIFLLPAVMQQDILVCNHCVMLGKQL